MNGMIPAVIQHAENGAVLMLGYMNRESNEQAEHSANDQYTASLLASGRESCAHRVGETCIEIIIAASRDNNEKLLSSSADLLFHLLILLKACNLNFYDVLQCLNDQTTATNTVMGKV